ncbi:hypothetical protein NVP1031O_190 [Vibrio phage 1.031.O._10N.261.46.F8]|nr:hypothetical protein NVP1031O_190 [Vibrio phage 1.031.O._10N.261.46.F8]
MTNQYITQKFASIDDLQIYAVEEGLMDVSEALASSETQLRDVCEGIIKRRLLQRRKRKGRIKDKTRSRSMKKLWKNKRRNFMKGIKKFNKSIKGKRVHQKVARNRKAGKYRTIHEWYTDISSVMTHLSIAASYTTSINEEAEMELLLEEGHAILSPVLEQLLRMDEDVEMDFNEHLNKCDAGLFLDDMIGLSAMYEFAPEDVTPNDDDISEVKIPDSSEQADTAAHSGNDYMEDDQDKPETITDRLRKDKEPQEKDRQEDEGKGNEDDVEEAYNPNNPNLVDIFESFDIDGADYKVTTYNRDDINENKADNLVDGTHIIGRIVGPAFFPGSVSRNKVEYTTELWNHTIQRKEFQNELSSRRLYGAVGHDQPIDDEAIRDGMISHILNRTWINDEGVGMAEYLMLPTKSGRMITNLFGAGSKVRVSTRARGKFLNKRNSRGNKEPDPKHFYLRGIDFVHDPGFLQAEPSMAKS